MIIVDKIFTDCLHQVLAFLKVVVNFFKPQICEPSFTGSVLFKTIRIASVKTNTFTKVRFIKKT